MPHPAFDLYRQRGDAAYIGEPVSQLEHASQSGQLALEAGATTEVVLAAFFHDIGHLCDGEQMAGFGTLRHERVGAAFLREHGVPERVAGLVEQHVQAKRYLTFRYPDYAAGLSEASRETLHWQGGPMTETEAAMFEQHPDFDTILQMRRWDEQAKLEHQELPDLAVFETILNEVMKSK